MSQMKLTEGQRRRCADITTLDEAEDIIDEHLSRVEVHVRTTEFVVDIILEVSRSVSACEVREQLETRAAFTELSR